MTDPHDRPDLSARPFDLRVERTLAAAPAAVYRAWTTTDFDRWFAAPGSVWMVPVVEAPYFFESRFEGRHPHYGRFLRLEPERLVEMTWVNAAGTAGVETVLTVELRPAAAGTQLSLRHAGFADAATRDRHAAAWPTALAALDPALAADAPAPSSAMRLDRLRQEYEGRPLVETTAPAEPFAQLRHWMQEAIAAGADVANGMTLATSAPAGQPSARVVLLKEIDDRGLVFFTNYDSRKGRELAANPRAAALFWWVALHRQVRVEGTVERLAPADSDAYFASRPRASNLSAMASPQSQPVEGRAELERRVAQIAATWDGRELERPAGWGGYRLLPGAFEFFQGRPDRLHDRLRYERSGTSWAITRLAP